MRFAFTCEPPLLPGRPLAVVGHEGLRLLVMQRRPGHAHVVLGERDSPFQARAAGPGPAAGGGSSWNRRPAQVWHEL
jgi:hypothetical protein